jgi:hypothetical protein
MTLISLNQSYHIAMLSLIKFFFAEILMLSATAHEQTLLTE